MEELKKEVIVIGSAESFKGRDGKDTIGYTIISKPPIGDKERKFTIWKTKKDGTNTKAFTQYQALRPMVDDEINISYKEEEKEYTYEDKSTHEQKTGKSLNRTIMFFNEEKKIPTLEEIERENPPMPVF